MTTGVMVPGLSREFSAAALHRLIADNVLDLIWMVRFENAPIMLEKIALEQAAASDATPFGVRFEYFSPSVERILGHTPEEALQLSLDQILTPESYQICGQFMLADFQASVEAHGDKVERVFEIDHVHKDGSIVPCEITAVLLNDEHGKPFGALGVTRDISRRRQDEAALREERRLLKQLLELHERDRQILAYEIHDGLVQGLAAAMMHLEAANSFREEDSRRFETEYQRGLSLLRESVHESRRLISGLRPPILDEYGLVSAIEYLANETLRSGLHVQVSISPGFPRLVKGLENSVFRIVQEGLNNARKYSHADEVRVELAADAEFVLVRIVDQGVGFVLEEVSRDRFGLRGIRERTRLLEGSSQIITAPGMGTKIEVKLPILLEKDSGDEEQSPTQPR